MKIGEGSSSTAAYQACLNTIIEYFSTGDFYREIYNAKKEYFNIYGVINEDDPDYENKMDLFLGWYLFDRHLTGYDISPVLLYYRRNTLDLTPEERNRFKNLSDIVHSIFELVKMKGEVITVRDLGTRKKIQVADNRYNAGFSKGDIFEGRIVPTDEGFSFVGGFCFHPKETVKFIEKQMKKIRDDDNTQRSKLLLRFATMQQKHHRFPHIDLKFIYATEPKI